MNQFVQNILPFCSVIKKHCNLSNYAEFLRIQAAIKVRAQQSRCRLDWGRVCVCKSVRVLWWGQSWGGQQCSQRECGVHSLIGRPFFGSLMARPRMCLLFSAEQWQNKYLPNSVCVCKRYCGAMSWLQWVLFSRKSHCTTGSPNFDSLSGLCFLTSDYLMPPLLFLFPLSHWGKMGCSSEALTFAIRRCMK